MLAKKLLLRVILSLASLSTTVTFATADGPDYFQIKSQSLVILHEDHNLNSKVLTKIPSGARGLKNIGCVGMVPIDQWDRMKPLEKEIAKEKIWCKVAYQNFEGWIQNKYLREDSLPGSPTFDCTKVTHQVENEICKDPDLIYLDHYMANVYQDALKKASLSEYPRVERVRDLETIQRGWIKGRNDCWKMQNNIKQCISDQYSLRITYLQARWMLIKPTRIERFVCNSPYNDLKVSFFSTELLPSLVIEYGNQSAVFIATKPITHPAQYEGEFGSYFTINGKNATFLWDQFQPSLNCKRK